MALPPGVRRRWRPELTPRGSTSAVKGAAEKLQRRQRGRRRAAVALLALLLLAVALVATWFLWFRDSSVVSIQEVRVVGLQELGEEGDAEEIEQAARTSVGGMTTLNASESDLEGDLSVFPRVSGVEIDTDFPSAATVAISVRGDGSILGEGSQALLIADDGTILGSAEGVEGDLPALEGDRPAADATSLEGPDLSKALVLGAVPAEIRPFVVSASSGEQGIEVALTNGLTLVFGDDSKAEAKWRAAASVIADPELSGATSIDLSYPLRPAVRF